MLQSLNRLLHPPSAIVLACGAALLPFALGCASSTSTASTAAPVTSTPVTPPPVTPSTVTDVYVAGVDYINGVYVATVWKNGVETQLGGPGFPSRATSVATSGSDVYVVGAQGDSTGLYPTLWKNGVATRLASMPGHGTATAIALSGSTVLIAGTLTNTSPTPVGSVLWTNGVASALPLYGAYGMALSGSDVYVTGFLGTGPPDNLSSYHAAYTKNGIVTDLGAGLTFSSNSNSIFVQGSDVYVGGFSQSSEPNNQFASIWKNGQITYLSTNTGDVFSVYSTGSDVYAAGTRTPSAASIGDGSFATLWKSGVATDYSIDAAQSIVLDVTVSGNSLYAVGFTDKGAYLWKDGVATVLPSSSTKATANAITIYQH